MVCRKPVAFIGNAELTVYDENKRSERGVKRHGQVKHRAGSAAMSLPEQVHALPMRQRHSNGNKRGDHGITVDFCGDLTTRGLFSEDLRRLESRWKILARAIGRHAVPGKLASRDPDFADAGCARAANRQDLRVTSTRDAIKRRDFSSP